MDKVNPFKQAAEIPTVAFIYFLGAQAGLWLGFKQAGASSLWLPSGVALAAVLILGYRIWPGIVLAAFLTNVLIFISNRQTADLTFLGVSLLSAAGYTLQAVTGALLYRRLVRPPVFFESTRDVFKFLFVACVMGSLSAAVHLTGLCLFKIISWSAYENLWFGWSFGDTIGILVLAPFLMLCFQRSAYSWRWRSAGEAFLALILLISLGGYLLGGPFGLGIKHYPLAFLLLSFIVWAGLRFDQRAAAGAAVLLSGLAIWGTSHGLGPFVLETPNESLMVLQIFLGTVSIMGLFISTLVMASRQAVENRFLALLDSTPSAVVIADGQGRITLVNRQTEKLFGYVRAELIGRLVEELLPERLREMYRERLKGYFADPKAGQIEPGLELYGLHKDGREMQIEIHLSPLTVAGETLAMAAFDDVADRKRLDTQARYSQKMEAIGHLAGGLAHDFNNTLTVIKGYAELQLNLLPRDSPQREDFEEVLKAGKHASVLVTQLLSLARRQVLLPQVINPHEFILEVVKTFRHLIRQNIELVAFPGLKPGAIRVDPTYFEQVLLNLVLNASDAMPNGGKLVIETQNVQLGEDYVSRHTELSPGNYVVISVRDTGMGMSEEVKKHLFEPFFTTKEKGNGLGLATCHAIIKESGGVIEVESEFGSGTTIKIYMPCVEEKAPVLLKREENEPLPKGTETVLIVEDEESIRKFSARVLRQQGYRVLEAADGGEALLLARKHMGEGIHLLLTDLVMPRMGGMEVASRIKSMVPPIRVMIVSGYIEDTAIGYQLLKIGYAFLPKPFSISELALKVRETLNG